jgi:hypothetical protein
MPASMAAILAVLWRSAFSPLLGSLERTKGLSGLERLGVAVLFVIPDWAALGACFALAAAVVLFVFYIQPDASDLAPHRTTLDKLFERRDTIYDNLRDLKFEHRAGKYSEGDYELMKNSLEEEAAVVLTEIEQVTESEVRRPRPVRPPDRSTR